MYGTVVYSSICNKFIFIYINLKSSQKLYSSSSTPDLFYPFFFIKSNFNFNISSMDISFIIILFKNEQNGKWVEGRKDGRVKGGNERTSESG